MQYGEGGSVHAEFRLTDQIVNKATAALKLFAVFASNLVNLDSSELRENLAPAAVHSIDQCLVGEIKQAAKHFAEAPEANRLLDFLHAVFKRTRCRKEGFLRELFLCALRWRYTGTVLTISITRRGCETFLVRSTRSALSSAWWPLRRS